MPPKKRTKLSELEKARAELWLLYEISNAMRATLELEQILYIILTAVTCHEGLGFNRAMLFLVNEKEMCLEGKMGIGPASGEDAEYIWGGIEENKVALQDLINAYDRFRRDPDSKLHDTVKGIRIPLEKKGGVLARTALDGVPVRISDDGALKRASDRNLEALGAKYFVTVPLKAKDRVSGVLFADNKFTGKSITDQDMHMLSLFANHAGLAIENSRLYEKTVHLSNTDWLTGLWNHGYFQTLLDKEMSRAHALETDLTVMMIDIDDFKNYNDRMGHVAGDCVIKRMARAFDDASRKKDHVCRYGGEEFSIILPQTGKRDAQHIGERLMEKISGERFDNQDIQPRKRFTVSIGLASYPQDATDKVKLVDLADKALYKAKRSGKNRLLIHEQSV